MTVTRRILVLANSFKLHGRCVAGREIVSDANGLHRLRGWVRPVSRHGEGEFILHECLCQNGLPAQVMHVVEVPLEGPACDPCQPENWNIVVGRRWRDLSPGHRIPPLSALVEKPSSLWLQPGQPANRVSAAAIAELPPKQSLYLIRPEECHLLFVTEIRDAAKKVWRRCRFRYNGVEYQLALTDPDLIVRYTGQIPAFGQPALEVPLTNVLLCVSLAHAREGYHYKVVATVIEGAS